MIKTCKLFLIIVFAYSGFSFSQVLREINVSGNSYFDEKSIAEWSGIRTGTVLTPDLLDSAKNNILKNFAQNGFFLSDLSGSEIINSVDSGEVNLNLRIKEGEPAYVRNINFITADSNHTFSSDDFSFLQGQIFNRREVENGINSWLTGMENTGYPFSRALIKSVKLINDSSGNYYIDLTIALDTGIKGTINRIEITGNSSTKDYVIVRELRLKTDQLYSQKQVEEFPDRLNRLRFFEPVQKPEYYLDSNNEGVLLINVKEKQTNSFDGIVGYIPPANQQSKGYVTGLVNISLRNLFGTGRAAAVRWQQYDRLSQEMELRYLEPWIFSYPFNITAGLYQKKQDSTYVQRKLEASIEFLATEDISAGISINSESVIPIQNSVTRFTVFRSGAVTTGVNLKIDTRDDPYSPSKGLFLFNSYSFSRKKIYGPQQYISPNTLTNLNLQRITIDFLFFYQLFSRQIIAQGIHARELRGSSLEESDLFFLGGTNSLRGYREKQFPGSRLFWSNTEYRLLLTRRTFAFLFFDTGYYFRKEDGSAGIPGSEAFKTGYGAGLNIETGIGVLAVSYALASGDTFANGKIHFGIVNEF